MTFGSVSIQLYFVDGLMNILYKIYKQEIDYLV